VAPGQVGEIWVQSPSVAQGYWQRLQASEATFRAHLADTGEGPFLRTGDLGFLDDGDLFVTGRLRDLIIIRGVNYYPQDIELTVQRSHSRLRPDCGAVFLAQQNGRERLIVVQEVERHKHGGLDDIFQAIRRGVAADFDLALDAILLIKAGTIPKTSSGKIQRYACRNAYLHGSLALVGQWQAGKDQSGLAIPAPASPGPLPRTDEILHARLPRLSIVGSHGMAAASGARTQSASAGAPASGTAACLFSDGNHASDGNGKTAEIVIEEIRRVAKERAVGLTADSAIVDAGLDSLERMEILASLEERFGGRLPPDILPELETPRQLMTAVEQYLGRQPRARICHVSDEEVPPAAYRVELFPEYVQLQERLDSLSRSGLGNPYFGVHQGVTGDRTMIGGRELLNFASYNYIGASGHAAVSQAAHAAIDRYGTSVSASRLASGEKQLHRELEQAIARFLGTEAAIALVGGHATNETIIGHMVGPGDLVLHDALAHNSIVQGAVLSGARRRPFAHNQWQAANRLLEQFRQEYRRVLLVIEGVYSMDGDIPELPRFIDIRRRHKTLLMIDEAHSLGVLGATGRGIGEHFAVSRKDVDLWMGTMSKSLGSCGGYIAGSQALVEYLKYTAPGFVFSVGLPPPAAAAALASIRLLQSEPQRVARLRENANLFLTLARRRHLNTGTSQGTAVVPIIVGGSDLSLRLSQALFSRGINVQPILYPAVEESAARLRFFITSLHTDAQIRYTVEVLAEELQRLQEGLIAAGRALAA
ncbi:MAG: aminotransferase class I/II-fold pyridoxal phosphate-dependent enzyme, partial [Thermoguttaceae bacterium]|jgi:8-amino-7-oxononanoate synthase